MDAAAATAVTLQMPADRPSVTDFNKAEPSRTVQVPPTLPGFVCGCLSMYAGSAHQVFA